MFIIIEVFGSILGLLLLLCGFIAGDLYLLLGFVTIISTYSITSIGTCLKMKKTEKEIMKHGGSKDNSELIKAKREAINAILRSAIAIGGSCKNIKKVSKHISNPDNWGQV